MIEDNPGDVRLAQEAMLEARVPNKLSIVRDGHEALAYLKKEGDFADVCRPHLILLDLNLPKKDGREVLREIKQVDELRCIPVVILTSSKAEKDILQTYNLGANCYITKPVDFENFLYVMRSIENFWLTVVTLPLE
ncbi:MAG: response regulator [Deltaproteobacteria bacterium]|nr:response regulator [Deltaproteobacteria bacterium]